MRAEKNQDFQKRLGFAMAGIFTAIRNERSLRFQMAAMLAALAILIAFRPEPVWWALVASSSAGVISLELLNTALECLADHLHPEAHPRIGLAKDCAAAAVLIASCGALAVALALAIHLFTRG